MAVACHLRRRCAPYIFSSLHARYQCTAMIFLLDSVSFEVLRLGSYHCSSPRSNAVPTTWSYNFLKPMSNSLKLPTLRPTSSRVAG